MVRGGGRVGGRGDLLQAPPPHPRGLLNALLGLSGGGIANRSPPHPRRGGKGRPRKVKGRVGGALINLDAAVAVDPEAVPFAVRRALNRSCGLPSRSHLHLVASLRHRDVGRPVDARPEVRCGCNGRDWCRGPHKVDLELDRVVRQNAPVGVPGGDEDALLHILALRGRLDESTRGVEASRHDLNLALLHQRARVRDLVPKCAAHQRGVADLQGSVLVVEDAPNGDLLVIKGNGEVGLHAAAVVVPARRVGLHPEAGLLARDRLQVSAHREERGFGLGRDHRGGRGLVAGVVEHDVLVGQVGNFRAREGKVKVEKVHR